MGRSAGPGVHTAARGGSGSPGRRTLRRRRGWVARAGALCAQSRFPVGTGREAGTALRRCNRTQGGGCTLAVPREAQAGATRSHSRQGAPLAALPAAGVCRKETRAVTFRWTPPPAARAHPPPPPSPPCARPPPSLRACARPRLPWGTGAQERGAAAVSRASGFGVGGWPAAAAAAATGRCQSRNAARRAAAAAAAPMQAGAPASYGVTVWSVAQLSICSSCSCGAGSRAGRGAAARGCG